MMIMKKNIINIFLCITIVVCSIQTYSQGVVSRTTKPVKTTQIQSNKKVQKQSSMVSNPDGYINGHGYVDLGLPSGTKWATCNIGAQYPQDYGNSYVWGETNSKKDYTEKNSLTYKKSKNELLSMGIINSLGNLTARYDAACVNWGSQWRMPSKNELKELLYNCAWKWSTKYGKEGFIVTGPNNKSIFLPSCYYWISSIYEGNVSGSYELIIYNDNHNLAWIVLRFKGHHIRPVS